MVSPGQAPVHAMAVVTGAQLTPKCAAAINGSSADTDVLPAAVGEASVVGHLRLMPLAATKHLHAGVTAVAGHEVVPASFTSIDVEPLDINQGASVQTVEESDVDAVVVSQAPFN